MRIIKIFTKLLIVCLVSTFLIVISGFINEATFTTDSYIIEVASNNDTYGTVSSGGTFTYGQTCSLIATPREGYRFLFWTHDEKVESINPTYQFVIQNEGYYKGWFISDSDNKTIYYDANLDLIGILSNDPIAPSKPGAQFDSWIEVDYIDGVSEKKAKYTTSFGDIDEPTNISLTTVVEGCQVAYIVAVNKDINVKEMGIVYSYDGDPTEVINIKRGTALIVVDNQTSLIVEPNQTIYAKAYIVTNNGMITYSDLNTKVITNGEYYEYAMMEGSIPLGTSEGGSTVHNNLEFGTLKWNFIGNNSKYIGWQSTRGVQIGSSSYPNSEVILSTKKYTGLINNITVNSSMASNGAFELSVKVGGVKALVNGNPSTSLTTTATDYTFILNTPRSGAIEISYLQPETSKAVYIKSITINSDTSSENVANDKANLSISTDSIIDNFYLPIIGSNGSTISWESSNLEIISINNTTGLASVTRPITNNVNVSLTATIRCGTSSDTKIFEVTVLKVITDSETVASDKLSLTIENTDSITDNFTLPLGGTAGSKITWSSSNEEVISVNNTTGLVSVTRPTINDINVTLTATITKGIANDTKVFYLTVKKIVTSGNIVFDWTSLSSTSGTVSGISFETNKGQGSTSPAYNATSKELRLYYKGTYFNTTTALSSNIEKVIVNFRSGSSSSEAIASVYGSTDGSSWTLIGNETNSLTSYAEKTINFDITKGYRYVKIANDNTINVQVRIASIKIYYSNATLTPQEKVNADANALTIVGTIDNTVNSIILPSTCGQYGSNVEWNSNNITVINPVSKVVTHQTSSVTVTLTATITNGAVSKTKIFYVVVASKAVGSGYYASISDSLTGTALKTALRNLITSTHTTITSYDDLRSMMALTDVDPDNADNIILFYSGDSVDATWDGGETWNREHIWPQSLGWFSTSGAGADLHHLRPTDPDVNSTRNNRLFGEVIDGTYTTCYRKATNVVAGYYNNSNTFEPIDSVKGDVARILFYVLIRYAAADSYNISNIVKGTSSLSSIELLLQWNEEDPVSSMEISRNEAIYEIQGNRNPFIDNAEYAESIWG